MSESHLGPTPEGSGLAGSKAYTAKADHEGSDIPAEQGSFAPIELPEHQEVLAKGRSAGWRINLAEVDMTQRTQVPGWVVAQGVESLWLEGIAEAVYVRGRDACQLDIRKANPFNNTGYPAPKPFTPTIDEQRARLPIPLPAEVWERAKDDRPLVDIPEKPYWLLIENVALMDRAAKGDIVDRVREAVEKSGIDKVRTWRAAVDRFNALERDYMVSLAWWRGYRQAMIDHNQGVEQAARRGPNP